jgi:hypothetical protein
MDVLSCDYSTELVVLFIDDREMPERVVVEELDDCPHGRVLCDYLRVFDHESSEVDECCWMSFDYLLSVFDVSDGRLEGFSERDPFERSLNHTVSLSIGIHHHAGAIIIFFSIDLVSLLSQVLDSRLPDAFFLKELLLNDDAQEVTRDQPNYFIFVVHNWESIMLARGKLMVHIF